MTETPATATPATTAAALRRARRPARYNLDDLLDVVAREFLERGYDAAVEMDDCSGAMLPVS